MGTKKTATKSVEQTVNENVEKEMTAIVEAGEAAQSPAALAAAYDEFAGHGEKLESHELIVQRYRVVQAMTKGREKLGLKTGQFYGVMTKTGIDRALVVEVYRRRHIVERFKGENDRDPKAGTFVADLEIDDPRVVAALKANSKERNPFVRLVDPVTGNKFSETYDIHVIFLDEEDGVTFKDFGVLQCDSTQLSPAINWKNARVKTKSKFKRPAGAGALAPFFFRTVLTIGDKDNSKIGKEDSKIFNFAPYKDTWLDCQLDPNVPAERELLVKCKEHVAMIEKGAVKAEGDAGAEEPTGERGSDEPEEQAEF